MMNINRIFDPENRFWSFMEKIMNLCVIAFLWFLFSLPIVTMGAATTALFQYTLKLTVNEEGYIVKPFIRSFKENFVQATLLWLLVLAVGGFLLLDFYACQFLSVPNSVKWIIYVVLFSLSFVYILTIIYLFPLISFFKVSLKKAVVHSFVMGIGNLYVSVTTLVIYGVCVAATYFIPHLFMVWFALACYAVSFFYRSIFRKYMDQT